MPGRLRFPDFFVVGAPRCGTTAFCKYLSRNPQICFSQPKEPHYFTRLDGIRPRPSFGGTISTGASGIRMTRTDPWARIGFYLYLPDVIERIRRINPEARFIALVRNPLQLLPSYHLKMLYLLQEDEPDFEKAWALQPERARGSGIPKLSGSPAADVPRGCEARRTGAAALRRRGARAIACRDLRRFRHRLPRPLPARPRVPSGRLRRPDEFRAKIREPHLSLPLAAAAALRTRGSGREGGRHPAATNAQVQARWHPAQELDQAPRHLEQDRRVADPAHAEDARGRARCADADVEHLSKLLDRDLRHWLAG